MLPLAPLCFAISFASVSARPAQFPEPDTLLPNQIIVALGNSITEMGESPRGYVSLMRRVLAMVSPEKNIIIVNSGISGHKATDMQARFERDVVAYQPDWVTISVGINDVWHGFDKDHPNGGGPAGVPLPRFRQEVTKMIDSAYAHHIRVALFTTTVIQENLQSPENRMLVGYNEALREIAKQHHCLLIDQNEAFRQALTPFQKPGMPNTGVLTVDGVHMLPEGDWLMARTALAGFGISTLQLDELHRSLVRAIRHEEDSAEDAAMLANVPRTLFFGSPGGSDEFHKLGFEDRLYVTGTAPAQTIRQAAARLKAQLADNRIVSAVFFADGCADALHGTEIPESQSRNAVGKILQLVAQYGVKLAVVGTGQDQSQGGLWKWLSDSCSEHAALFISPSKASVERAEEIGREIEHVIGMSLIGMSGPQEFLDSLSLNITPLIHAGVLRYTLDGTEPTKGSQEYHGSLTVRATTVVKARLFYPTGEAGGVRSGTYQKLKFLDAVSAPPGSPGLRVDYYEGQWERIPNFDSLNGLSHSIVRSVGLDDITKRTTDWGAVFSGFIEIPADGLYTFYLRSDDGSRLMIDERMVADNDGLHAAATVPGSVALRQGVHRIKVFFFQREGGEFLTLRWKGEKSDIHEIPEKLFSH